jgi:serine/threonine protein kinase
LEEEISRKANAQPDEFVTHLYTERRIASYAWQLAQALAFCHSRGVYHSDFKAANILIDQQAGGTLMLCDFGCALLNHDEEVLGFTKTYDAPELRACHRTGSYHRMDPVKIDSYALGCVILELVCCNSLHSIMDALQQNDPTTTIQSVLHFPPGKNHNPLRIPWQPYASPHTLGYSPALKCLLDYLLDLNPHTRMTPTELEARLGNDRHRSPLLADKLTASQSAVPGHLVTVDNIQLGMFVQRGPDWSDGDADGGMGHIGVVTELDADARYCFVSWPVPGQTSSTQHCIGGSSKFELQVGPTTMRDFLTNSPTLQQYGVFANLANEPSTNLRKSGLVYNVNTSMFQVGQQINPYAMILGMDTARESLFVGPLETFYFPLLRVVEKTAPSIPQRAPPMESEPVPSSWSYGRFLEAVTDEDIYQRVSSCFYSGEMDPTRYEITGITGIQVSALWWSYHASRTKIMLENWGMPNENYFFVVVDGNTLTFTEGSTFMKSVFGNALDTRGCSMEIALTGPTAAAAIANSGRNATGNYQMVLCKVVLGRTLNAGDEGRAQYDTNGRFLRRNPVIKHSEFRAGHWFVSNFSQILPQYIISYRIRPCQQESKFSGESLSLSGLNLHDVVMTSSPKVKSPGSTNSHRFPM